MKNEAFDSESASDSIILTPIGMVRSEIKEPILKANEDGLTRELRSQQEKEYRKKLKTLVSEVLIDQGLSEILDGIEGFSHKFPNG